MTASSPGGLVALILATYNGSSFNLISWRMTGSWCSVPLMLLSGLLFAIA
ncbi:MAG: hypothetical protein RIC14_12660 [Filomicrobium sp.]